MSSAGSWLTVGAAIFAVRFVASEALFERSTAKKGKIVFSPVFGVRWLLGIAIPGGLFVASRIVETEGLSQNWFIVSFCVALSISAFVLMPGTLTITAAAVTEKKWFGLRQTSIPWANVEYVFKDPAERSITVAGNDGTTITHTQYHVDPDSFKDALKQYCPKFHARD